MSKDLHQQARELAENFTDEGATALLIAYYKQMADDASAATHAPTNKGAANVK